MGVIRYYGTPNLHDTFGDLASRPTDTYTTVNYLSRRFIETDAKTKRDIKSLKKPTAPGPASELDLAKLKKAQAKQARKDQIKRNGGKR